MIQMILFANNNVVYHIGKYKNIKTARIAKTRYNLKYGAHLRAEAINLITKERVSILS